jgi:predicted  nucleic acid-binding Zn-ribbon protein
VYYKEKLQAEDLEKLEKKVAELQKELEQTRQQNTAVQKELEQTRQQKMETQKELEQIRQQQMADKAAAQPELDTEVKELVEQMGRIPLLHYEILAYFHRFQMENKPLTGVRQKSAKKAD